MGRTYNLSKYFLLYTFLLYTCLALSSHAMQVVDASYISQLLTGPLKEFFQGATIADIEITVDGEENHPRWKMLDPGQSSGANAGRYRKAVAENIARGEKNTEIGLKEQHLRTREKKNAHKSRVGELEEENARLRAQVVQLQTGFHNEDALRTLRNQMDRLRYAHKRQIEKLTEEMEALRAKESDRARLLKTQISELQDMLTRQGFRVNVNMDVFEGPARSVTRSTVIAANPFIDIVEAIQNDLGAQLKKAEEQNALLLQEISETNEALANQLTENRRLEKALQESEFKVEQLESRLALKKQELKKAEEDMEHKWLAAMRMQQQIINELEATREMLREHGLIGEDVEGYRAQKLMAGLTSAASSLGSQSAPNEQALKLLRAKWKEEIKAERRKNVELGRRVKQLVLDLHELTTQRDEQVALIAEQREMIEQLTRQIHELEVDSDRFVASNKALRTQLGEVSDLLPVPIDEGASSSGPVNALDSLKARLALYMKNMEAKQSALRESQEQNEQSQAIIRQWEAYHTAQMEHMHQQVKAFEDKVNQEINELQEKLSEREEENEELYLEIEYLEKEKEEMNGILASFFQAQPRPAESASEAEEDPTDLMSVASVVETSEEPAAAATTTKSSEESAAARSREEAELEFAQRMQENEAAYLALEEEYRQKRQTERSEKEREIEAKEQELKQMKQALEDGKAKFEEDERALEERKQLLDALRSDVRNLDTAVKIRKMQNDMRSAQLEREIFGTEEDIGILHRRLESPHEELDATPGETNLEMLTVPGVERNLRPTLVTHALTPEQTLAAMLQKLTQEEIQRMLVKLVQQKTDLQRQVRRQEALGAGIGTFDDAREDVPSSAFMPASGHSVPRDDDPAFLTSTASSAASVLGEPDLKGIPSSPHDGPLEEEL